MGQTAFPRRIATQDQRHERVDGAPVAMAGARRRHDQIVVNATAALHRQHRGAPCRAVSADTAVLLTELFEGLDFSFRPLLAAGDNRSPDDPRPQGSAGK
jgi:hypothetical protein